mgnify:CR=1 FL=1
MVHQSPRTTQGRSAASSNVYKRHILQQAHIGKKRLSGIATVEHGNILAKVLCHLFRFPKASADTSLTVDCMHSENSMLWHRDFDGHKMESHFRVEGEFLVECLGPLALSFKAVEYNQELHYKFVKTRLLGIPMPNFLCPTVVAYEQESSGAYQFSVEVRMPVIGKVIRYSGQLELSSIMKS